MNMLPFCPRCEKEGKTTNEVFTVHRVHGYVEIEYSITGKPLTRKYWDYSRITTSSTTVVKCRECRKPRSDLYLTMDGEIVEFGK